MNRKASTVSSMSMLIVIMFFFRSHSRTIENMVPSAISFSLLLARRSTENESWTTTKYEARPNRHHISLSNSTLFSISVLHISPLVFERDDRITRIIIFIWHGLIRTCIMYFEWFVRLYKQLTFKRNVHGDPPFFLVYSHTVEITEINYLFINKDCTIWERKFWVRNRRYR